MAVTSFFQSAEFGQFQEKIPYRGRSWMLKKESKKPLIPVMVREAHHDISHNLCLVIQQKLKFGNCFLWIPYGPLASKPEEMKMVLADIRRIAKEEKAIFVRVEPAVSDNTQPSSMQPLSPVHEFFMNSGKEGRVKKSFDRATPETSLVLDLSLSEAEILKQMKPKGRYNIKVAEKNAVLVEQHDSFEAAGSDFDAWYEILRGTAARDGFHCHPKFFYESFLKFFGEKKMASLLVAKKDGKVIGGILVAWYGDTATYYYGASAHDSRQFMAPYLLQWEALKEAKKRALRWYDFFGIAPENAANHPWQGVTEFKKKFGGTVMQHPPAFDIVYRPFWYFLYRMKARFL